LLATNKFLDSFSLLSWVTMAVILSFSPALEAQNVTVVGSPQETNERIKTLTLGKNVATHDYVIGSGDLLSITVFDVPELTREVRVSQTGTVSIPLVPVRLTIAGLTEFQAEQKIAEVLEANGLVTHPEVGVMVREHKSKPITIVGAVVHPMVYEADRTVTLLEALAEAGGVSNDAGDTAIISRVSATNFVEVADPQPIAMQEVPGAGEPPSISARPESSGGVNKEKEVFPAGAALPQNAVTPSSHAPGAAEPSMPHAGNTFTINLNEILETGDMQNNITLQAGDVVTVPHAGIVYVLGAVSRPGGFVLMNDRTELTAMKVLALAGGLTRIAQSKHAYIVRTDGQGKQSRTEVDLKKILNRENEDVRMHASDILYIPDDRLKEAVIRTTEIAIGLGTSVALYRLAYH
jgi:protein involved in polysaccharide export with SLBB domain